MEKSYSRFRGGFTLTELLVVMGVTAVLAVLMFAAFNKVRHSGNLARDIGNMRAISTAVMLFTQDHFNEGRIFFAHDRWTGEGGIPNRYGYGSRTWNQLLRPYFGLEMDEHYTAVSAFISPGDPTRGGALTVLAPSNAAFLRRSYSFNIFTADPDTPVASNTNALRRFVIRNASSFMLFTNHKAVEIGTLWIDPRVPWFLEGLPENWFGGMANFAFLDGHVESIPLSDILPGGARHSIFYPDLDQ